MPRQVTYRGMERLLLSVGFCFAGQRGSHRVFTHGQTGTLLTLPSQKMMSPANVQIARRMLDERGILDRDRFEELLVPGRVPRRGQRLQLDH